MINKTKFLKFTIAVVLGAGLAGVLYAQLDIPTNISNAVQTIMKINLTQNGQSGTAIVTLDGSSATPLQVNGVTQINGTMQLSGSAVMGSYTGTDKNTITNGSKSSILGGKYNDITNSDEATVVGGNANDITGGYRSVIVGGYSNTITNGQYSAIAGGQSNKVNANYGFVAGGVNNVVNGQYGFAGGRNAVSNAQSTFVWADATSANPFTGSTANSFVIRAAGGMGINTASPTTALDVVGTGKFSLGVRSSSYCDQNGQNCRAITELVTGGSFSGITEETDPYWNTQSGNYVTTGTTQTIIGQKTFSNVLKVQGNSIYVSRPVTAGGYARGISFYNTDFTTSEAGMGVYGVGDAAPSTIIIGFGGSWWSSTNSIILNSAGNVGIGTTNPGQRLDVVGTGRFSGGVRSPIYCDQNGANCKDMSDVVTTPSGTETDPTVNALAKATLGCTANQIAKYNGTTWTCAADVGLTSYSETDPNRNSQSGNYVTIGTNQTITGVKRFANNTVFDTNVGIGTSPSYSLDIRNENPIIQLLETDSTGSRRLMMRVRTGSSDINFHSTYGNGGNYPFTFSFGGSVAEVMRIAINGNVGMGTTNPEQKLDVVGTGRFSGGVRSPIYCDENGSNCKNISGVVTSVSGIETDPTVNALAKATLGCTANQIVKYNGTTWTCAADAGLTSYSETDPIWNSQSGNYINTGATSQTKAGNLTVGGDLTVQGNLIADKLVNRTVTDISVSGGVMPDPSAPVTYKRLGTGGNRWNELYVTGINAAISEDLTSSMVVVVKDSSNNLKTRNLNSVAFNGENDPKVGNLNDGYVSMWSGSTLVDSNVYQTGGKIGIGTTNPTEKLEINGNIKFTNGATLAANTVSSRTPLMVDGMKGSYYGVLFGNSTSHPTLMSNGAYMGIYLENPSRWLFLYDRAGDRTSLGGGNIGIGTTTPAQKLDVVGTGRFSGGVRSPIYCDENGSNCKDMSNVLTSYSETDPTVNALAKATLGCTVNQIAKYNGTTWTCATDEGLTSYSETDPVFLANSGVYFNTNSGNFVNKTDNQIIGGMKTFNNTGVFYGKVGIGTSSPVSMLEIVGGVDGGESVVAQLKSNFTSTNTATTFKFVNSTNSAAIIGSEISSLRTNVGSAGSSDLIFRTSRGTTMNERMRIVSDGNIGIGTDNPSSKLTIQGGTANIAYLNVGGTGNGSMIVRHIGGKNTGDENIGELYLNYYTGANIYMVAGTNKGNVGIGTTNPGQRLDVVGTGRFSSGVRSPIYCDELGANCKDMSNLVTTPSGTETDPTVPAYIKNGIDWSEITSVADKYMTYKPNNVKCSDGGVLKWRDSFGRWDCGEDHGILEELDPIIDKENLDLNSVPRWDKSKLTQGVIFDDGTSVGINTNSPDYNLHVVGDEYVTNRYGGVENGTAKLWAFDKSHPNYGIFYTKEDLQHTIDISPNGGGTSNPVMSINNDGVTIQKPLRYDDGTADVNKVLVSTDTDGNATWKSLIITPCAGTIDDPNAVVNGSSEYIDFDIITTKNREYSATPGACKFKCLPGHVWDLRFGCVPTTDGECGAANGQNYYTYSEFSSLTCTNGTFSGIDIVANDGIFNWSCKGSGGGTTATCSANKKVNGSCGTSNNKLWATKPTTNLCSSGTATSVSTDTTQNPDKWSWSCNGINGGTTASCTARANARSGACTGLPSNTVYYGGVTTYTITQTVPSGSPTTATWTPTLAAYYAATPSANTCGYTCATNYHYEGSTCISNTQTRTGQVCLGKITNSVWNTASTITQTRTWSGGWSIWGPTTTGIYSVIPYTTQCRYMCNEANGYYYSGGVCRLRVYCQFQTHPELSDFNMQYVLDIGSRWFWYGSQTNQDWQNGSGNSEACWYVCPEGPLMTNGGDTFHASCGLTVGDGGSSYAVCRYDPDQYMCFVSGTKVLMQDNTLKSIEEIKIGDYVKGPDGSINKVLNLIINSYKGKIYGINNKDYFVTPNHPFMTTKGWKSIGGQENSEHKYDFEVGKLMIGDVLIIDGGKITVNNIYANEVETKVYNLSVDGNNQYYANGYLVHNKQNYPPDPTDPKCPSPNYTGPTDGGFGN